MPEEFLCCSLLGPLMLINNEEQALVQKTQFVLPIQTLKISFYIPMHMLYVYFLKQSYNRKSCDYPHEDDVSQTKLVNRHLYSFMFTKILPFNY